MKKVILVVVFIVLWIFCIEDEKDYFQIIEICVVNCEIFKDFSVFVKEGYIIFVIFGEDILVMVNEFIIICIFKNVIILICVEGDGINISYMILDEGLEIIYVKVWQVIMFEDMQNGDYDYNDLIIYVKNIVSNYVYQYFIEIW